MLVMGRIRLHSARRTLLKARKDWLLGLQTEYLGNSSAVLAVKGEWKLLLLATLTTTQQQLVAIINLQATLIVLGKGSRTQIPNTFQGRFHTLVDQYKAMVIHTMGKMSFVLNCCMQLF